MSFVRATRWLFLVPLLGCQPAAGSKDAPASDSPGGIAREDEPASSPSGFTCHYPPDREIGARDQVYGITMRMVGVVDGVYRSCQQGDLAQMYPELVGVPPERRPFQLQDPWGRPWQVMCNHLRACVYSLGPDGVDATSDDIGFCHRWMWTRPPYAHLPPSGPDLTLTEFRTARAAP